MIITRLLFLPLFCLLTAPAFAQSASTGAISAQVLDPDRRAVSGARLTLRSTTTGLAAESTADQSGFALFPSIPPGVYEVTATRSGFRDSKVTDVSLRVGARVDLRIDMPLAAERTAIEVRASAVTLDETPSVSTVVNRTFIEQQPLNGRTFQGLIALTPGAVLAPSNVTAAGQFSVNGQRANANYFTLDGTSANFGSSVANSLYQSVGGTLPAFSALGGTNTLVSVDAVEEFRVQTSTYAPEHGRQPGAQVNIVTRSGSNEFHGALFHYFRNDKLDANDWFANANGLPRSALRQNDFGGVLGGPIQRNRLFFFTSYEGLRLRLPQTSTALAVPDEASRRQATGFARDVLSALPLPNAGPAEGDPRTGLYVTSFSNQGTLDSGAVRTDYHWTDRLRLFGRYSHAPSQQTDRAFFATPNTISPLPHLTVTGTTGVTWQPSTRAFLETRFNFSRAKAGNTNTIDALGGAVVPPNRVFFPDFASPSNALGIISVGDATLNLGVNSDNRQNQWNLVQTANWVLGPHTLKFGFDYRRLSAFNGGAAYTRALFFDTVADVLANNVNLFLLVSAEKFLEPVFQNYSLFAQDVWRANPRLTLTYGLRWDVNPAPSERNGNLPRVPQNVASGRPTLAPQGTPFYETRYGNIAPRIGAAYRLDAAGATVLRGGLGMFYDLGYGFIGSAVSTGAFPFGRRILDFEIPVTDPRVSAPIPPATIAPPYNSLASYEPGYNLPYTLQYNVSVERKIGSANSVTLGYVGANGRRLSRVEQVNLPDFPRLAIVRNASQSSYHALQAQFERTLSSGVQFIGSYAWAKSLDDSSTETRQDLFVPREIYDVRLDRGRSDFDVRHNFSLMLAADLPSPVAGSQWRPILGGFGLDAFFRSRTNLPVNVLTARDALGIGFTGVARPDLVPGVPLYLDDPKSPGGTRINRQAFSIPSGTRQGNFGRNAASGFPATQLDLSLRRRFSLSDRLGLTLRVEAFNLLNQPNFAAPANRLNSPVFGQPTQMLSRGLGGLNPLYQQGGPRSLQLSLRLAF